MRLTRNWSSRAKIFKTGIGSRLISEQPLKFRLELIEINKTWSRIMQRETGIKVR